MRGGIEGRLHRTLASMRTLSIALLTLLVLASGATAQAPAIVGAIYITDAGNNRITRISDMTGAGWTAFGAAGSGPNQFNTPVGIYVDTTGHIYVADSGNHRIVRINDFSGTGWVEYGLPGLIGNLPGQFSRPLGIFIDAGTRIYVADAGNNRLVRFSDMTGGGWVAFGSRGNRAGQFLTPSGIFVSSTGRIYVVDLGNNRIVRMNDMTGDGWTAFGAAGAEKDQFALPRSVFVR